MQGSRLPLGMRSKDQFLADLRLSRSKERMVRSQSECQRKAGMPSQNQETVALRSSTPTSASSSSAVVQLPFPPLTHWDKTVMTASSLSSQNNHVPFPFIKRPSIRPYPTQQRQRRRKTPRSHQKPRMVWKERSLVFRWHNRRRNRLQEQERKNQQTTRHLRQVTVGHWLCQQVPIN